MGLALRWICPALTSQPSACENYHPSPLTVEKIDLEMSGSSSKVPQPGNDSQGANQDTLTQEPTLSTWTCWICPSSAFIPWRTQGGWQLRLLHALHRGGAPKGSDQPFFQFTSPLSLDYGRFQSGSLLGNKFKYFNYMVQDAKWKKCVNTELSFPSKNQDWISVVSLGKIHVH